MLEAKVDGELTQAGPDSPEVAQCPACGGEVCKRKRKVGRDWYTYLYRHCRGVGNSVVDCPSSIYEETNDGKSLSPQTRSARQVSGPC